MNNLITVAIDLCGLGWIWKKIDGYKTKLGAIGMMLGGAGAMLIGAANLVLAVSGCADMPCVVELARGVATNPDALMMGAGYAGFSAGLTGLGIGCKIEKAEAKAENVR